jgi:hypothetical protein
VTPAADGSWSATIAATSLQALGNAGLTVTPTFAVPDVSTGAAAHIGGVGVTVQKHAATQTSPRPTSTTATPPGSSTAGGVNSKPPAAQKPSTSAKKPAAKLRVSAVHAASRLTLTNARRHGIKVSFVVPRDATVVQVQVLRGTKTVLLETIPARRAATRQTVVLKNKKLSNALRSGRYTVSIRTGTSRKTLGTAVSKSVRIH